jgi:DNA-binding PadR family transcriptional regulator
MSITYIDTVDLDTRRRDATQHRGSDRMERSTTPSTDSNRRTRHMRRKQYHMYDTHHHGRHRGEHSRGGHGPGRGDGHGRHRARRGALLGAVLTLLDERPMHGYELITELEDRSEGRWRPSPGAMYPALKKMVMHELVTAEEIDGKRQFSLTDAGRERLAEVRAKRDDDAGEPWEQTGTGGRGELRGSVAELIGQARQIGRFGTTDQIEQARGVFDDAKRKLYAILAEVPSENPDDAVEADDEDD